MKLTKSKLKEIIKEEIVREQSEKRNLQERRPPKDEYFLNQATTAAKAINDMLRIWKHTTMAKENPKANDYYKMLKLVDKELVNKTKKILGY